MKRKQIGMQENNMPKAPSLEASEEELKQEFQEILRKRKEYEKEIQQAAITFQEKEALRKQKIRSNLAKVAVIVLVAGTCLIGFASRSEATRMWWLSSVERIIGRDTGHVVNNDENRVIYDSTVEMAIAEIEEKTGIPMPEFKYRPQNMVFDGYDYDEMVLRGSIYYLYNDYVISLNVHSTNEDTSYSWNYDGDIIFEKNIDTTFGTVSLVEVRAENDTESNMSAEWEYMNHQYHLVGKMPIEEMEKIILNILY